MFFYLRGSARAVRSGYGSLFAFWAGGVGRKQTNTVTGTLAVTEGADTAAFTGNVLVQGTLAATEGADTAAFIGTSGAVIVAPDVGSSISGGSFSRGRWRAMREVQDAKRKKRKRLPEEVLDVAAQAIEAAKRIGSGDRINTELGRLAAALKASDADRVVLIAGNVVDLVAEQEDEDDIEFLLLAA